MYQSNKHHLLSAPSYFPEQDKLSSCLTWFIKNIVALNCIFIISFNTAQTTIWKNKFAFIQDMKLLYLLIVDNLFSPTCLGCSSKNVDTETAAHAKNKLQLHD